MPSTYLCDYIQFTEKGKPFDPFKDQDLITISIDVSLFSDLKWNHAIEKAKKGKKIFWHLDFNFDSISFYEPRTFASFLLGIDTFNETLLLPYQEKTFGVSLYQGGLFKHFKWDLEHDEAFNHWKASYLFFPKSKELYFITLFSEYLHRLAAALPDEILPIVLFDPFEGSEARMAQFLSREHFSYLYVGLKNHPLPIGPFSLEGKKASIGVTLPLHSYCSEKSFRFIDQCIDELRKQKIPFRIIAESHLTESWDHLDALILFSDFLSHQGRRKVQGFVAAGGKIILKGKSINIEGEITWDEFRGRGI